MVELTELLDTPKLDYQDVLLLPQPSSIKSRSEVELIKPGELRIIAANMDFVGTFDMAKALAKYHIHTALTKHYSIEELVGFYESNPQTATYAIYSMGANQSDYSKLEQTITCLATHHTLGPTYICIDVANGYSETFIEFIRRVKKNFPGYQIIAGNVCTPEQAVTIMNAGASYVKVGIGPGSVCTTRIQTGVGMPQFSAVVECASAVHTDNWYETYVRMYNRERVEEWLKLNRPNGPIVGKIIADGGCTNPGDVAKAFGAGADAVMLGSMFAGCDEGGGEKIGFCSPTEGWKGPISIKHYGMASKTAQEKHNGGLKDYRSSEGREVTIDYKGPVENVVKNLLGGLRSACVYTGHTSLQSLVGYGKFVRVNHQYNTSLL